MLASFSRSAPLLLLVGTCSCRHPLRRDVHRGVVLRWIRKSESQAECNVLRSRMRTVTSLAPNVDAFSSILLVRPDRTSDRPR